MSIRYIILGYLNTSDLTGYELKKAIATHPFLPWSGNNNQIYKALTELEDHGYIQSQRVIQSLAPNKKIYHIKHAGRALLQHWLYEPVSPADFNHPLLVKLQFADLIKRLDWMEIFINYRQELQDRLYMQKLMPVPQLLTNMPESSVDRMTAFCNEYALKYETERLELEIKLVNQFIDLARTLGPVSLADNPREPIFKSSKFKPLAKKNTNYQASEMVTIEPAPEMLTKELVTKMAAQEPVAAAPFLAPAAVATKQDPMAQAASHDPSGNPATEPPADRLALSVQRLDVNGRAVLELVGEGPVIGADQDALDLLALCSEHQAHCLMASTSLFQDDFFRLKTGLAGAFLQKLVNYQVRLALVRQPEQKIKGKFMEFISESNQGGHFAVLENRDEAIRWLTR